MEVLSSSRYPVIAALGRGLQNFRFHDLRHTGDSRHRHAGTDRDELKELGGWKSRQMVDRYAKFATGNLRMAAARTERNAGKNVVPFVTFLAQQKMKKACA